MSTIKYGLKCGNYTFPVAYNGFTFSYNKIWSDDTGRNNNGDMIGTIVAIKRKCECKLTPLTYEQAEILNNLVSDINNPFVTLYFNEFGEQGTMTGYFGDISFPLMGTDMDGNGKALIVGVTVDVIEK